MYYLYARETWLKEKNEWLRLHYKRMKPHTTYETVVHDMELYWYEVLGIYADKFPYEEILSELRATSTLKELIEIASRIDNCIVAIHGEHQASDVFIYQHEMDHIPSNNNVGDNDLFKELFLVYKFEWECLMPRT